MRRVKSSDRWASRAQTSGSCTCKESSWQRRKRPKNIPSRPHEIYGEHWVELAGLIGYEPPDESTVASSSVKHARLPEASSSPAKRHGSVTPPDECRTCHHARRTSRLRPTASIANDGWVNYGDWLGTGNTQYRRITPREFHAAREFARSLGLSKAD